MDLTDIRGLFTYFIVFLIPIILIIGAPFALIKSYRDKKYAIFIVLLIMILGWGGFYLWAFFK